MQDSQPDSQGPRATVERWSAAPVVFLHRLPRWLLLGSVFALLAVGMAGDGWVGAAGLLVLAALLGWFGYLNWPRLDRSGRLLRVAALVVLLVFAGAHLVG